MIVRILLFARAKELARVASMSLEVPEGSTVAGLREALAGMNARLGEFLPRCAVAVGGELVGDERELADGAEVAVLPPVSGG